MRFEWDEEKNRQNLRKHDVRFESAILVFEDPSSVTLRDSMHGEEEERFVTLGSIGPDSVLFVVHTLREQNDEEIIRIVSARAATSRERRAYEDADKDARTGHRSHRSKKRQRHRSL